MLLSVAITLFIGLVISVIQLQEYNSVRSRAETATSFYKNCLVTQAQIEISIVEQNLLNLINNYRQQNGVGKLEWSDDLIRGASWMSDDMFNNNYLSHTDSLGRDMQTRLTDCGYNNYTTLAENVDSGSVDALYTFESWKHSPPHNANLLNPQFTEAGIALESDSSNDKYYWTLDLGSRSAPSPTSVITITPVITQPYPSVSISPTAVPTQYSTPTPGTSRSPTSPYTSRSPTSPYTSQSPASPTPTPIVIYPLLTKADPDIAYEGSKIFITGKGGYRKLWDGGYDETAKNFKLYFDGNPAGKILCYGNYCQGEIAVPNTSVGIHIISTEGGSKISITIVEKVPPAALTPTNTPIPTLPPDYSPNPLDMQLFVSAKVVGIGQGGNTNPRHLTRRVTVEIYDMDNKIVTSGWGYLVYDKINLFRGVIHMGPVEEGKYYIKVLSEKMLQSIVRPTFQELKNNRLNILPEVTMLQGDIDSNNKIDIVDYNTALSCFQNKKCEDYKLIDFNDNDTANVVDYNILLHVYWETLGD